MNSLTVLQTGFLCTIQDDGRRGYQRFGMPVCGPMDWYAFRAGNYLLGNPDNAAGIEIGAEGIQMRAECDCLAVLCGHGYELTINRQHIPMWMVFYVHSGQIIKVTAKGAGGWGYLTFYGGVRTPLEMRSRSTYLRGKLGGYQRRTLQVGDFIPLNPLPSGQCLSAGKRLIPDAIPDYSTDRPIEIVDGIHKDRFTETAQELFTSQLYTISADSDRMGYRLDGSPIPHEGSADVLSNGMTYGTIQVPGNGKPIVMMADHPTTGGYPQIASVIAADLPIFAQRMPGIGKVAFRKVSVEYAQMKYQAMLNRLRTGIWEDEDEKYRSEF